MLTTSLAFAGMFLGATAGDTVTFEMIGPGSATGVSADGSVVVGNTEDFGTFRWTESTGIVDLGRNPWAAIGRAAGTPDVSADGSFVSASILDATGTYLTTGRWSAAGGWIDLMPPTPPDGGILDQAYGSAWAMSGDGSVVTGLYWRPGSAATGLAHAMQWTESGGTIDLGSDGRSSRGSGINSDGTIIVGFDEAPGFGNRRPAIWVNGVKTVLYDDPTSAPTEASAVTDDGTFVVGQSYDGATFTSVAAGWRWDGTAWNQEIFGVLPGTFPEWGSAIANDVTPAGNTVVGYNAFDFGPFAGASGFVWTQATGMVDIEQILIDGGVALDPMFDIQTVTAISDDGRTLVGLGIDWADSFRTKSFRITLPGPEPGVASCFGVGCPCGNDDPDAGCANSSGAGGLLSGSGTTSVATDDLVLEATQLSRDDQGLFYMGDTLAADPFFDGIQCAVGNSFRFLGSIQSTGSTGTMSHTGFAAEAGGLIAPGTTWHFHGWHRDFPTSPCGTGANLTNLYSVTFTP